MKMIYIYIYLLCKDISIKCIFCLIWKLNVRYGSIAPESLRSLINRYALCRESGESFDPVLRVHDLAVTLPLDLQAVLKRYFHAFGYCHLRYSEEQKNLRQSNGVSVIVSTWCIFFL